MTRGRTARLVAMGTGIAAVLVVALVFATLPARRRAVEAYGKQVKVISRAFRDALEVATRSIDAPIAAGFAAWNDAAGELPVDQLATTSGGSAGSSGRAFAVHLESAAENPILPTGTFERRWAARVTPAGGKPVIDVAVDAAWGWPRVPSRLVAVVTDAGAPENRRVLDLLLPALDAAGVQHRLERRSP